MLPIYAHLTVPSTPTPTPTHTSTSTATSTSTSTSTHAPTTPTLSAATHPTLLAGLRRTWDVELFSERSALWGAIFLVAGGARSHDERVSVLSDVLWSLRSWPLDQRQWPVNNSHRLDVILRGGADRFHKSGARSHKVLPANERRQYRWNADPFDIEDGGDGMVEAEPSAWLIAYWMARFHGLLDAGD